MSYYRSLFVLGLAIGVVIAVRSLRSPSPPSHPTEREIDEGLEDTFPASDPPAPHHIT
jgi:hypothetical protein